MKIMMNIYKLFFYYSLMYVIKISIYAEEPEYVVFRNKDEIIEFLTDNIICNNYDGDNTFNHSRYSIDNYVYILRDDKYLNEIQLKRSKEFGSGYNIIKNLNKTYFKCVYFDYDYEINVDILFSDDDESAAESAAESVKYIDDSVDDLVNDLE